MIEWALRPLRHDAVRHLVEEQAAAQRDELAAGTHDEVGVLRRPVGLRPSLVHVEEAELVVVVALELVARIEVDVVGLEAQVRRVGAVEPELAPETEVEVAERALLLVGRIVERDDFGVEPAAGVPEEPLAEVVVAPRARVHGPAALLFEELVLVLRERGGPGAEERQENRPDARQDPYPSSGEPHIAAVPARGQAF
jgi:hypothetical protein